MKIEMINSTELNVDCSTCARIFKIDTAVLGGQTSVLCPYCGKTNALSEQTHPESNLTAGRLGPAQAGPQYVVGSHRTMRKIKSGAVRLTIVAVVVALLYTLGGGRYSDNYFLGVKRTPGFAKTLIDLESASAFGMARVEQKLQNHYAYILVSYHEKTGLRFFRPL